MKRTAVARAKRDDGPVYLDCNATAPLEPAVADVLRRYFGEEVGNAGSRTHEHGTRAKKAVQQARDQVAAVVEADPDEVIFTSGATEANNLAILGLAEHAKREGRRHIVSTGIEHKAILEPLEILQANGFEVELVPGQRSGSVSADAIKNALRPDTVLVSVMQVNNETGARQPIADLAALLAGHDAFFHVDAAQGFGKDLESLQAPRIDLISVSSHKMYGPVGVGALIARRRQFRKPPLQAIAYGGGQERGLRPGTLPVPLIVGFGLAAQLARENHAKRSARCRDIRAKALAALAPLGITLHSDESLTLPHVLNFSVPGIDSEALIVALKDLVSISNGSACTSQSYSPSHVLQAMGLTEPEIAGAVRLSWSHLTPDVDWAAIAARISSLR